MWISVCERVIFEDGTSQHHSKSVITLTSHSHPRRRQYYMKFCLILGLVLIQARISHGGSCYMSMDPSGNCLRSALVSSKTPITKEECCNQGTFSNLVGTSWSDTNLSTSGSVFFMDVQGGVPCSRCKDTCDKVRCPENYKCAIRKGIPKCVCAPNCTAFRLQNGLHDEPKGRVCGTDGRTYKSICRLLKRSCRQRISISIAYYGVCKMTCSKLICTAKKQCLLDQNLTPHCVHCSQRKCSSTFDVKMGLKSICAVDGLTYYSLCHLRQAACQKGKAIPVAYKGPCKKKPNCNSVKCSDGQKCLVEPKGGKPRCVTCSRPRWCRRMQKKQMTKSICSSNGKSYNNWCDMMNDACLTGIALDTKYLGQCKDEMKQQSED